MQAMMMPNGNEEKALTSLVHGLDAYVALLKEQKKHMTAEQHAQLTATVVTMTKAALNLADGPLGRLDSALLRQMLSEIAGIDLDSTRVVQLHGAASEFAQIAG